MNCLTILAKEKALHSVFEAIEMQLDSPEVSKEEPMQVDMPEETKEIAAQPENLDGIIEKLRDNICKRQLDVQFRIQLLRCVPGILRHNQAKAAEMADKLQQSLGDYDQMDVQRVLGKSLCKLWLTAGTLIAKCDLLQERINMKEGIELNEKRNMAIYVHQIILLQGSSNKEIQDRFLKLQQIFLKFLFDRRATM